MRMAIKHMVFIVESFLGPEFRLWLWPVAYENILICEMMVKEQRWQTNPLAAYHEGIEDVILWPSQYSSLLPGCTTQILLTLACHLFGKRVTFSTCVKDIVILKEPDMFTSERHEGSSAKRKHSGPSLPPKKHHVG